ncbi:MAG: RIP metalloprotease RseP [Anaerolineae bacterium]
MFDFLGNMSWMYLLVVIPVLGVLVFVHELGHFLAARRLGVQVDEFGFGLPPRAMTMFERDGVKYTLNWLPLGGFVRMAGEEGDFETPGSLWSKRPWQRATILVAGPFMNFLAAAVLFSIVFMMGVPAPAPNGRVQVYDVFPGSPAQAAGLQRDDLILSVDGKPIDTTATLVAAIEAAGGREVPVAIERGGQPMTLNLTPRASGEARAGISIGTEQITERYGPVEAVLRGIQTTASAVASTLAFFGKLIAGLFTRATMPEGASLSGPIGIARITGQVAQEGFDRLLALAAIISVSLGTLNLLPLPALDGGRLLFVVLEWVRGKRISPEREAFVHAIGMVSLLLVMLIVSYFDVARWIGGVSPFGG